MKSRGLFLGKSRERFGPGKSVVRLQPACCEKLIFEHFVNIRKTKKIAKFDALEPRRCEDVKGIVAPEIGSKSFGTFEKQAQDTNLILALIKVKSQSLLLT